jgi:hypothetical protein
MEASGQLHHQGKSPWYQLDRQLGGPQRCSGLDSHSSNSLETCFIVDEQTVVPLLYIKYSVH